MKKRANQSSDTADHLKTFERACRNAGLKITHQRTEVFRELTRAADHPSAEIIHSRLREKLPSLSIDTVYRTLSTLEKHGLITKVQTTESQARFEVNIEHHHHLICDRCHEIIDFNWAAFDDYPLPDQISRWGTIKDRKVILHGLCRKCTQVSS